MKSLDFKAALVSLLLLALLLGIWAAATQQQSGGGAATDMTPEQAEYARMMGKDAGSQKTTGFPTLAQMGTAV
ncbi:MAG TPA: nitrate ABC transporter, permease protein, partial [Ramlibacter sp.]|nr:nitrate ABC transporter, permease protein [Ramlibacter sp.]